MSLAYAGADLRTIDRSRKATLFTTPTQVLADPAAWRQFAEDGFEIGNACLLGVTDDGRVPNWTLRMIEQELFMAQQFFSDFFEGSPVQTFLYPGKQPWCAGGNYRHVVDEQYTFAVSQDLGINVEPFDVSYLAKATALPDLEEGWAIVFPELGAIMDLESYWVATVAEVAEYVRVKQTEP